MSVTILKMINKIREGHGSNDVSARELGEMISEFRNALGMSPQEFAKACEISLPTYYRWIRDEKPPRHRISAMERMANSAESDGTTSELPQSLEILSFPQLLDRMRMCSTVWCLKNDLPFVGAQFSGFQKRFLDFLELSPTQFHCLFFEHDDNGFDGGPSQNSAMHSFGQIKKKLDARNKDASEQRFRSWKVSNECTAFQLGLSNSCFSVYYLIYSADLPNRPSALRDRKVDMFLEVPILPKTPNGVADCEAIQWLELSPDRADRNWTALSGLFDGILRNEPFEGLHPFPANRDELESYVPREYAR